MVENLIINANKNLRPDTVESRANFKRGTHNALWIDKKELRPDISILKASQYT